MNGAKMMTQITPFEERGASPYRWWITAHELEVSSRSVPFLAVHKMLFGMSLECLLKGIMVANDPTVVSPEKFKKKTHDLCSLADAANLGPDVAPSSEERAALNDLTPFIRWIGRYPIPLDSGEQRAISDSSPHSHRRRELWNRLERHLRKCGWVLKADGSKHPMPDTP